MKVTNDIIIKCAKEKGFKLPKTIKLPKTQLEYGKLPIQKMVRVKLTENDIEVIRARTSGNKDLGEWWVGYTKCLVTFRVTDLEIKSFIRNKNINDLISK